MRHLIFQLCAPIMSFGSSGAKQERATDSHPSEGFALGFLGAALGKKRDDPWHKEIAGLGFGTLTVKPGVRVEDYHTVATPRGIDRYATRREEAFNSDYTVETYREYLSDACFLVAFWGEKFPFISFQEALIRPTFELFAGRKSCPLSLPPAPLVIEANTLADAFSDYLRLGLYETFKPKDDVASLSAHWGVHHDPGIEVERSYARKDNVVDRAKRLYMSRVEYEGSLRLSKKD